MQPIPLKCKPERPRREPAFDNSRLYAHSNFVLPLPGVKVSGAEGIDGTVYAHAIGDHGHGAGAIVGLYDHQEGVPGRGDTLVLPSTWFSIELQATSPIPEWDGQKLRSAQEEEALLDADGRIAWAFERQTRYQLVAAPPAAPVP